MRVGQGFDVHRLITGRRLILGGVEIPFEKGLLGHSDADVLVHAVMDALLGAAALGDIGQHFPPDDSKYKDAESLHLLGEVKELLHHDNFRIVNVDATLVAEEPRLAGFIPQMRKNVARVLDIPESCVSIKATTTEGLGFTGRGEGIAALASVLISRQGGLLTL